MIIYVRVRPNSLEDSIKKIEDGSYLIKVKEKAIDGKANLSLIRLLSKEFGVSVKDIIIKNPKGRKKIIEIIK